MESATRQRMLLVIARYEMVRAEMEARQQPFACFQFTPFTTGASNNRPDLIRAVVFLFFSFLFFNIAACSDVLPD